MFKFLNIYKYLILVFSIMILSVGSSFSSDFPNKMAIEMIIGFKPGGFSDAMARKISEPLTEKLGQTVVHKYMGGAGGGIAATAAMIKKADGYTLLVATSLTFAFNPHQGKVTYNKKILIICL